MRLQKATRTRIKTKGVTVKRKRNGGEEILGWRKIKFEYPNTGMMMSTGCSTSTPIMMGFLRPASTKATNTCDIILAKRFCNEEQSIIIEDKYRCFLWIPKKVSDVWVET